MADTCNNDLAEDIGNKVHVYEGADVTPDDVDGDDGDPLAMGQVTQDQNGAYAYSVTFLSPGEYTVAFTCQGLADTPDSDDDIAFTARNATLEDDQETDVSFPDAG